MTANQINFAALQETKRSNLAKEELTRTSNAINLEHYQRADAAAANQAESARLNALTNQRNADINAYNATVAKQNADTNLYATQVKQFEAEQRARQAAVAERLAPSQIALNQAKANESQVNALGNHPIASTVKLLADNAGSIAQAATQFVRNNAGPITRVVTATTPSVLVNAATDSVVNLPYKVMPIGVQNTLANTKTQGGRRHE